MKRSIIWNKFPTKREFQNICSRCTSLAEILREHNLHPGAGNYRTLKNRILIENIDISHIPKGKGSNKGRKFQSKKIPLNEILIEDSRYQTNKLKIRLLKEGILTNSCSICGLENEWNGKPITHRLDHINGNSSDHRLENLRIVCPNCDSQLDTFAGRNSRKAD